MPKLRFGTNFWGFALARWTTEHVNGRQQFNREQKKWEGGFFIGSDAQEGSSLADAQVTARKHIAMGTILEVLWVALQGIKMALEETNRYSK